MQMRAYVHQRKEADHDMHKLAWLSARVNDTDRNQKPKFKVFTDFYKQEETKPRISKRFKKAIRMAREINE